MKCKSKPGKHIGIGATMGCANYHGWLCFENGERWIVRILRTGFSDVPLDLVEYLVKSEYATLKFLQSTKVPEPKPFAFGLGFEPSNRVGVGYMLMQSLPGKPFYTPGIRTLESQKKHAIEQLGEFLIEISKNPLPSIGSLVVNNDKPDIGPVAPNRFITLKTYGAFRHCLWLSYQYNRAAPGSNRRLTNLLRLPIRSISLLLLSTTEYTKLDNHEHTRTILPQAR